jgi:predicted SnoaL-like aldol condensation-catalyzing enzyme
MSAAIPDRESQLKLLESDDPRLAANKRLVFDMYREIVQGGHADRVSAYFTPGYIQHNPNAASGRDALAAFLRGSRPARPLEDEGGQPYVTSWFDFYRIEDGRIAEHWDPALKSAEMLKFDPNRMRKP